MREEFFNIKFKCGEHDGKKESSNFSNKFKKVFTAIWDLENDVIYSPYFVDNFDNT